MKVIITKFLATVLLLLIAAVPLVGQASSRSADASASVTITPVLTLTKTVDLSFGSHFALDGIVASTAPARWEGSSDVGSHLSASFVLPSTLARVGNGDPGVPISFGNESALFGTTGTSLFFNPNTGLADFGPVASSGTYFVELGLGSAASQAASVNLTGHRPGTYSGVITLTITVL